MIFLGIKYEPLLDSPPPPIIKSEWDPWEPIHKGFSQGPTQLSLRRGRGGEGSKSNEVHILFWKSLPCSESHATVATGENFEVFCDTSLTLF